MTQPFIEHVNLTVRDPDASAAALSAIFGWQQRWRGPARDDGHTIHLGTDTAYVALYSGPAGGQVDALYPKGEPLNHVGVQVDDLDATEARVIAAGLIPFNHGDYKPGRRFYFLDRDGIEFEVISYTGAG